MPRILNLSAYAKTLRWPRISLLPCLRKASNQMPSFSYSEADAPTLTRWFGILQQYDVHHHIQSEHSDAPGLEPCAPFTFERPCLLLSNIPTLSVNVPMCPLRRWAYGTARMLLGFATIFLSAVRQRVGKMAQALPDPYSLTIEPFNSVWRCERCIAAPGSRALGVGVE